MLRTNVADQRPPTPLGNHSPPLSHVVRCFRRWRSRRVEGPLQPGNGRQWHWLTARRTMTTILPSTIDTMHIDHIGDLSSDGVALATTCP